MFARHYMKQNKTILLFGTGELQKSLILRAKAQGLFVVGIDPSESAACKKEVDAFEVIDGRDFNGTIKVAKKYDASAIITTATDKPLRMMAKVAKAISAPFFSEDTAIASTDKFKMKELFMLNGIPCAKGRLIREAEESGDLKFPLIVKPRDNSGSRGVKLCHDIDELRENIREACHFTKMDSVLVEEYIEGPEYSIESLHQKGKSFIIQFTEKKTTQKPYNVELGHKEPANLTEEIRSSITVLIRKIANSLGFDNCASHTELKINKQGIYVIETSPRLGGDFITSHLVPLSTGINIEDQLINIAMGKPIDLKPVTEPGASGICFFNFPNGKIIRIDPKIVVVNDWDGVHLFRLNLHDGDRIPEIKNSIDRYGEIIVKGKDRLDLDKKLEDYENKLENFINFKNISEKNDE
ncbi:MAG TPA: hypothetical protein DIS88_08440 [Prevotella sp.]|nr:hypothetical protein [Prevotella sp.]